MERNKSVSPAAPNPFFSPFNMRQYLLAVPHHCLHGIASCEQFNQSVFFRMIFRGLKGDETAYREEVQRLTDWCTENNLALNTKRRTDY